MIEIFKIKENVFERLGDYEKDSWVNVAAPDTNEIKTLASEFDIPEDFLTDSLDANERARIETEGGCMIIIVRVPFLNDEDSNIPFSTLPVGIILPKAGNRIITICSRNNKVLTDFITGKVRNLHLKNRIDFILKIFLRTTLLYLFDLQEINKMTTDIEEELHGSIKNRELIELLNLEKSLVYFTTSLKSNDLMMMKLQKVKKISLSEEEGDMLEDIVIDNRQAIAMADIYSNILSGMMDAFASVISNNLNIVMKFLTSISIILMIPTLIASLYGMNVKLPFQASPYAFLITIIVSLILSIGGISFFIRRKWF
ncbi:MAG: magnesium transporter CorA family protein [Elusimicrobiota bacterium]|nr:magnesium transporter CorA family protein [Elusimicrobiota bacterium]